MRKNKLKKLTNNLEDWCWVRSDPVQSKMAVCRFDEGVDLFEAGALNLGVTWKVWSEILKVGFLLKLLGAWKDWVLRRRGENEIFVTWSGLTKGFFYWNLLGSSSCNWLLLTKWSRLIRLVGALRLGFWVVSSQSRLVESFRLGVYKCGCWQRFLHFWNHDLRLVGSPRIQLFLFWASLGKGRWARRGWGSWLGHKTLWGKLESCWLSEGVRGDLLGRSSF